MYIKSSVVHALILILCPLVATAAQDPTIKGIKLGETEAALRKQFSTADCSAGKLRGAVVCSIDGQTFANQPCQILVQLIDGEVIYVEVFGLDRNNFGVVASALRSRYGIPSGITPTGQGDVPNALWSSANWNLIADPYDDKTGSPIVVLTSKSGAALFKERQEELSQNAANDL